jgi:hypothetical protein
MFFLRFLNYTGNEGPARIPYKCLVPIYVFPEMKLCSLVISKTGLYCSVSQFLHSYFCESFIYFQDQSVYFAAAKYVDRSWEYIFHFRNSVVAGGGYIFCCILVISSYLLIELLVAVRVKVLKVEIPNVL